MTFARYGLMPATDDHPASKPDGPALGYVDNGKGQWVMNCLACHGGRINGQVIPGRPNTEFDLQTLTEDVAQVKVAQRKGLGHLESAAFSLPLSTNVGTTNSVVFGVVLAALRDKDMRVDTSRKVPPLVHHDLDAPPFWNVKYKTRLYADGFSPKNHRVLMQFMMLPVNNEKVMASWEDDFKHIQAWIDSVEAPQYPWPIDQQLANQGRHVFNDNCASCHGSYQSEHGKVDYPEKVIPIAEIGTDPVRLNALNVEHRSWMKNGWMSHYGRDRVDLDPGGYVAPPLVGIWASAPYFHNGSVPTLWHVLHPADRPKVWKRKSSSIGNGTDFDRKRIGVTVDSFDELPDVETLQQRRHYFDTTASGKSASGHTFPDALSEPEKTAVLEYLKSL